MKGYVQKSTDIPNCYPNYYNGICSYLITFDFPWLNYPKNMGDVQFFGYKDIKPEITIKIIPGLIALGDIPQGSPPQGSPPQGSPPQGFPPQGSPPQGSPPQGFPPQGSPPQGSPPQGSPPQGSP